MLLSFFYYYYFGLRGRESEKGEAERVVCLGRQEFFSTSSLLFLLCALWLQKVGKIQNLFPLFVAGLTLFPKKLNNYVSSFF